MIVPDSIVLREHPPVEVLLGDVRKTLARIPTGSIHTVITSPPYHGLREYGGESDMIGLEPTWEEHLEALLAVFDEVARVLHPTGTLWLNYGDRYTGSSMSGGGASSTLQGPNEAQVKGIGVRHDAKCVVDGLPDGSLAGLPWRLAFALQARGWFLRCDCIWAKPSCMPSSVKNRPTRNHEYLFLLARGRGYYYDAHAIREPLTTPEKRPRIVYDGKSEATSTFMPPNPSGRNKRSVWVINPEPLADAHFAAFPTKLVTDCVLAGTSEKGACPACGAQWKRRLSNPYEGKPTVNEWIASLPPEKLGKSPRCPRPGNGDSGLGGYLIRDYYEANFGSSAPPVAVTLGWDPTCECGLDPVPARVLDVFLGSGTTALVASRLGRHAVGCEINPEYVEIARRRILAPPDAKKSRRRRVRGDEPFEQLDLFGTDEPEPEQEQEGEACAS